MPKGVANTKKATAIKAILEVIIPAFFERNQPDKPILTSKLKQPTLYPINIEAHKTSINVGSNIRGKLGSCEICKRHDATTATNKEQAASADDATIQLTDFLGEEKTTIVTKIVAETPAKRALTKESCSATATINIDLESVIELTLNLA